MAIPPVNEPKMIPIQEPANMEDQNAEIKMRRPKCGDQKTSLRDAETFLVLMNESSSFFKNMHE